MNLNEGDPNVKRIMDAAKRLNSASDTASEVAEKVEEDLRKAGTGIEAECEIPETDYNLIFARMGGVWRLGVRKKENLGEDEEDRPLSECVRFIRVLAVREIHVLLKHLADDLENELGLIDEKTGK